MRKELLLFILYVVLSLICFGTFGAVIKWAIDVVEATYLEAFLGSMLGTASIGLAVVFLNAAIDTWDWI